MPAQDNKPEGDEDIYSSNYDVTSPLPQHTPEQRIISQSESPSIIGPRGSQCDVRRCVVKVTRHNASDTSVKSTEREFLRNIRPIHSNIVQYFEITDDYIFMEQCLLGSLDRYLASVTHPPVVEWIFQLCDALAYVHSLGWAYNHLRPSNVLVANEGSRLKICDFSRVTAITGSANGALDDRGDGLDIYSLGLMAWFLQNRSIPDDLWDCHTSDRVRSLPTGGLQLTQIMDLCWSRRDVRPSAMTLHDILREILDKSNIDLTQPNSSSQTKPPTDEKLAPKVGSFPANPTNVRLAVVKFPRWQLDDPDDPHPVHLSFFAFHVEHTFLRTVKPIHPNIVQYLAVTDNCIYTEYHIGSLERYLTPDIKPPVFEWTSQLCSALAYLHGLGFAHCDFRPHNILVGNGGSDLLLSDFGTVTRAHLPCDILDDHSPPECSITIHQTKADAQEHPADAADVYLLGSIVWYIQNGGKAIPPNYIWDWENGYGSLDAIHSHLDIVDLAGLQLTDFIRECWAPRASRPTARNLLDRLSTGNRG